MFVQFFFLIFLLSSKAFEVKYDGYKVFKIIPQTKAHLQVLDKTFQNEDKYDVWSASHFLNKPWIVMVEPSYVNRIENILFKNKIKSEIINDNVEQTLQRLKPTKAFYTSITFDQYYRYNDIQKYLRNLAILYPTVVELLNIGKSYENLDIFGMKISIGEVNSNKPAILIDAGIHGREWSAPAAALYIINQIVENMDNIHLYRNVDWYIIPVLNPDGYEYTHTTDRLWRKTRSKGSFCFGVDANRNFDFHWGEKGSSDIECEEDYAGKQAFSENETQAFRDFVLSQKANIKLYISLHSFGSLILYPWSWTTDLPDNVEQLNTVAEMVSKKIKNKTGEEYKIGSAANVLYLGSGGSDDWMMGVVNVPLSYTVELPFGGPDGFDPPESEILNTVQGVFEGIKAFHTYVENTWVKNNTEKPNVEKLPKSSNHSFF